MRAKRHRLRLLTGFVSSRGSTKAAQFSEVKTLDDSDWVFNPSIPRKQVLDEAMPVLAGEDVAAADLAKLRLFAGLSIEEAAIAIGSSRATTCRHWIYARAWLQAKLSPQERPRKI